jgi:hypothetical protein
LSFAVTGIAAWIAAAHRDIRNSGYSGRAGAVSSEMTLATHQNYRSIVMKEKILTIPELILIAGTRVALGVGIGLLARG